MVFSWSFLEIYMLYMLYVIYVIYVICYICYIYIYMLYMLYVIYVIYVILQRSHIQLLNLLYSIILKQAGAELGQAQPELELRLNWDLLESNVKISIFGVSVRVEDCFGVQLLFSEKRWPLTILYIFGIPAGWLVGYFD